MTPKDSHSAEATRRLGRRGEQLALAHLERRGFRSLARNVHTRLGEIDLVVYDGVTMAFVEVKARRLRSAGVTACSRPSGDPLLGWPAARQRRRLRRLALAWLSDRTRSRPRARVIRFDLVRVILDTDDRLVGIEHHEGVS